MMRESQAYWFTLEEAQTITRSLASFRDCTPNEIVDRILLELASFEARFCSQGDKFIKLRKASNIDGEQFPVYLSEEELQVVIALAPLPIGKVNELRE